MSSYEFLSKIKSPEDLKGLSDSQLNTLCSEIRKELVEVVSKNGGHLASNLGVVELTVALHKVFDLPKDKIVWDVGHQCYAHKMLTGRFKKIDTIRKKDGLSGFPKREESEYDAFNVGHSSTSISAAYGLARANAMLGENNHTIAVIGDGALTGGLAYEGINNSGRFKKNFIVILNDNKMSISKNVGSMARYLAGIRTRPVYLRIKSNVEKILIRIPIIGNIIRSIMLKSKSVLKNILYKNTFFEDMGFVYHGPFDGHDINKLISVLEIAKKINRPVLIHILTKKGKGYQFAENNPKVFHGISGFDIETGQRALTKSNFSDAFGIKLCKMASEDKRICAITAAMRLGTGLLNFGKLYKSRFFDVGIAEEHAVTFASGLAAGGMLPVFAVYSTFLQRGYDQIIHDAAAQNLKVVLAIDRAGIVGEDGETHQGIFDTAFLNSIPNVSVFAPSYYKELDIMLDKAMYEYEGVCAVRYPRGGELFKPRDFEISNNTFDIYGDKNASTVIITYGRLFSYSCIAMEELKKQGKNVCIIKLNVIKPIDINSVKEALKFKYVVFFEEGIKTGAIGEHFSFLLNEQGFNGKYILKAIEDKFVTQDNVKSTLNMLGLDSEGMINTIVMECLD